MAYRPSPEALGVLANHTRLKSFSPAIVPFAGRIGDNQSRVLDPEDPANESILRKLPDAAPYLSFRDTFSFSGFADSQLWKYAIVECIGTAMIVFSTAWLSLHPTTTSPDTESNTLGPAGIYSTSTFIGPLVGGIGNWLFLTLFIYTFSSVSGAHLNPTITFATFFARITSFPRLVLYLAGQALGGAVAGFILTTAFGTRNFTAGGCVINTALVSSSDAFVLEFCYSLILIFLSFGVGLDPRQANAIGSTLSPWLVGLVLGLLSFGSSFTRSGYSGASLNPARCFGVYVGSEFADYHWLHWAAPLLASMSHGIIYYIIPPWHRDETASRN